MAKKVAKIGGVLPVFQTPFHDDETIDWETLEKEIHWLFDRGAHGVVMALASELLRLSGAERDEMAAWVCRTVGDRGAVIISVGAESSYVAERYALHAETSGASAVMAIPPIATGLSTTELRCYYERLLKCINIPVIIQDASGYVGKPIPLSLQAELMNEYGPHRVMFKPEASPIGPRLSALREATGGKALIFEGSGGGALFDSHHRGASGTMAGADLHEGIVALWDALEAGDDERALRISLPVGAIVAFMTQLDAFLAVEKYLLVKQGLFQNTVVRGPVGYVLEEETRSEVDRFYDRVMNAIAE